MDSSRPLLRARGECAGAGGVLEQIAGAREQLQHLLRVLLPIGGGVEYTAGPNDPGQQPHEPGLKDAPLVVALLGPGIRE